MSNASMPDQTDWEVDPDKERLTCLEAVDRLMGNPSYVGADILDALHDVLTETINTVLDTRTAAGFPSWREAELYYRLASEAVGTAAQRLRQLRETLAEPL